MYPTIYMTHCLIHNKTTQQWTGQTIQLNHGLCIQQYLGKLFNTQQKYSTMDWTNYPTIYMTHSLIHNKITQQWTGQTIHLDHGPCIQQYLGTLFNTQQNYSTMDWTNYPTKSWTLYPTMFRHTV